MKVLFLFALLSSVAYCGWVRSYVGSTEFDDFIGQNFEFMCIPNKRFKTANSLSVLDECLEKDAVANEGYRYGDGRYCVSAAVTNRNVSPQIELPVFCFDEGVDLAKKEVSDTDAEKRINLTFKPRFQICTVSCAEANHDSNSCCTLSKTDSWTVIQLLRADRCLYNKYGDLYKPSNPNAYCENRAGWDYILMDNTGKNRQLTSSQVASISNFHNAYGGMNVPYVRSYFVTVAGSKGVSSTFWKAKAQGANDPGSMFSLKSDDPNKTDEQVDKGVVGDILGSPLKDGRHFWVITAHSALYY